MRWSIPSNGSTECSGRNYYAHWISSLVQLNSVKAHLFMTDQQIAVAAIVVAAGSELIGMSKLRSNSWIQLGLEVLKLAFPKRRR